MENKTTELTKSKSGRPAKYTTVEALQKAIDEYFESLFRPVLVFDKETKCQIVLKDKNGTPYMEQYKPATINGLARALGFNSRQSLLNYQEKEEFLDSLTRAKAQIEEYAEERLYDKDGCNGAKFVLQNCFKWAGDKQEIKHSGMAIQFNFIEHNEVKK
jgi:hypothetical protein